MMMSWESSTTVNEWTGTASTRYLRVFTTDDKRSRVYTEVYALGGRYYWTANVHIAFRPDLSRVAYGSYAAVPGSLAVAKGRASRTALAAIRQAQTPRHTS